MCLFFWVSNSIPVTHKKTGFSSTQVHVMAHHLAGILDCEISHFQTHPNIWWVFLQNPTKCIWNCWYHHHAVGSPCFWDGSWDAFAAPLSPCVVATKHLSQHGKQLYWLVWFGIPLLDYEKILTKIWVVESLTKSSDGFDQQRFWTEVSKWKVFKPCWGNTALETKSTNTFQK